jgi:3-oxoacyl-[acyl-carrier-protein] synthase II
VKTAMKKRVVITGVGLVSCLGTSSARFHRQLCRGTDGAGRTVEHEPQGSRPPLAGKISCFEPELYLKGRSLRPLDRTGQLLASAARMALENSGWTAEALTRNDVGLVLGTMFGSMHTISEFDRRCLVDGPACVSPMNFANTVINSAASQTAIWHNLRGMNSTTATGATSGLVAIGYAADLIKWGRQTAVLAGGADQFCFEASYGLERAGLCCKAGHEAGCFTPFDARRSGMRLAEAGALLVLEDWNSALARGATVLGEIQGHANGYNPKWNRPDHGARGIIRAMRGALEDARLSPPEIDCISAGANGSVAGDRNEGLAIKAVFNGGSDQVPITAIKSGIGETLGAAGALQAIDLLETMCSGMLPGIAGLEQVDAELADLNLNLCCEPTCVDVDSGMISSVGFDGHACSLIISKPQAQG